MSRVSCCVLHSLEGGCPTSGARICYHMLYLVISEPSFNLQNSSSQHLVWKGGWSVVLGGCLAHAILALHCHALPCFLLLPLLRLEVDFFAVEGRYKQSWAEQMFQLG